MLASDRVTLDKTDKLELDVINDISLDTYVEGETVMRRLETLISKKELSKDPAVLKKQQEILEIKNTDLYSLIAKLKLIFSLLGIYKMDQKVEK
jgi:hypothetical protein